MNAWIWFVILITKTFTLTPKDIINRVFTRHGPTQMSSICDVLIEYSLRKSMELKGSDKIMFSTIIKQLISAQKSIKTSNETKMNIYFGWVPTNDQNVLVSNELLIRNDNVCEDYNQIPLYFIFVKIKPETRTFLIEKIIYNPSIQMNIDPSIMKYHLDALTKDSNTTLDTSPLREYDNGRWHLILSDVFNLQMGNTNIKFGD